MENWNIYQSVAYSAEGPLCVLVWSFTTRSQIKYLSHLNKKASAGSRPMVVCRSVCVCVCAWGEKRVVCYQGWLVWSPGRRGCVEPVRMEIWDSPPYLLIHRDWNQPQLNQCAVATEGAAADRKSSVWPDAAVCLYIHSYSICGFPTAKHIYAIPFLLTFVISDSQISWLDTFIHISYTSGFFPQPGLLKIMFVHNETALWIMF